MKISTLFCSALLALSCLTSLYADTDTVYKLDFGPKHEFPAAPLDNTYSLVCPGFTEVVSGMWGSTPNGTAVRGYISGVGSFAKIDFSASNIGASCGLFSTKTDFTAWYANPLTTDYFINATQNAAASFTIGNLNPGDSVTVYAISGWGGKDLAAKDLAGVVTFGGVTKTALCNGPTPGKTPTRDHFTLIGTAVAGANGTVTGSWTNLEGKKEGQIGGMWIEVHSKAPAAPIQPSAFHNGETVVFFGDSITHGGYYEYYLQTFYATRFPDRRIGFENAGIAGANVGGSYARRIADVYAHQPSRVLISFGMNDVWRDLYVTAEAADEGKAANRSKSINEFGNNLRILIPDILATTAAAEIVTPSPYDQYNTSNTAANLPFCDSVGLTNITTTSLQVAQEKSIPVIDLHTPLAALVSHPEALGFTWAPDRIHPNGPGYICMARTIIAAQGITGPVAQVKIDNASKSVVSVTNCTVTGVVADSGGLSFTYTAKSLPFPTDLDYATANRAKSWDDINREGIQVVGLAAGNYHVWVGGVDLGAFSDSALATGIDIAGLNTPQQQRARLIRLAAFRKHDADISLRVRFMVESNMRGAGVDPANRTAADAYMAKNGGAGTYNEQCFTSYRHTRDNLTAVQKEVLDAQAAIEAQQVINPQLIRIIPAGAVGQ